MADVELAHHRRHDESLEGPADAIPISVPGIGRGPDSDRANPVIGGACDVEDQSGGPGADQTSRPVVVPRCGDVRDDGESPWLVIAANRLHASIVRVPG